jgi:hypothetical protein
MGPWQTAYATDLQGVYALWVVPLVFLVYIRLAPPERPSMVAPGASRLMRLYAVVFGIETILDPLAGGLLVRGLGVADGWIGTAAMFLFVLLGDLRVLLLVFYLLAVGSRISTGRPADVHPGGVALRAARWMLIVPLTTAAVMSVARTAAGEVHPQIMWLVYELGFLALACWLRGRVIPRSVLAAQGPIAAYLRDVTAYVALYYALWATADVLILTGQDLGWALRMLPNQLYYALYLPIAYGLFFSSRYVETSSAAQAAR